MKIATVNVIEYADNSVLGVTSFSDNDEGNKEAEENFKTKAIQNGADETEMDTWLEEGYFEQGDYQIFLAHSA